MSVSVAVAPNFILRRAVAVLVLALVASAIFVAAVSAGQPPVQEHFLKGGAVQVSGFDGGAPVAPAGQ